MPLTADRPGATDITFYRQGKKLGPRIYFYPLILMALLLPSLSVSKPIITRHDRNDSLFVYLAETVPESQALFFFSRTDMAGTLIRPGWILAAAHVATDLSTGDSISTGRKKYPVLKICIHPEWKNDHAYDIALIRIDMRGDSLPPVPLYTGRDELNRVVTIVGNGEHGTGLTGPDGNDGRLRAATNRIVEVSDFWLKWDFDYPASDQAGVTDLEGISGPGDSSGPAFIFIDGHGYLAGISSAQSTRATNGREGLYGVREYYVRVSGHINWINATIAEN
jgi:hypothetical protein